MTTPAPTPAPVEVPAVDRVLWCDASGIRVVEHASGLCLPEYRVGNSPPMWINAGWEDAWVSGSSWEEIVCGMAQDYDHQTRTLAARDRQLAEANERAAAMELERTHALEREAEAKAELERLRWELDQTRRMLHAIAREPALTPPASQTADSPRESE